MDGTPAAAVRSSSPFVTPLRARPGYFRVWPWSTGRRHVPALRACGRSRPAGARVAAPAAPRRARSGLSRRGGGRGRRAFVLQRRERGRQPGPDQAGLAAAHRRWPPPRRPVRDGRGHPASGPDADASPLGRAGPGRQRLHERGWPRAGRPGVRPGVGSCRRPERGDLHSPMGMLARAAAELQLPRQHLRSASRDGPGPVPADLRRHARPVPRPQAPGRARRPSEYLRRIWYDALVYTPQALRHLVDAVGAVAVIPGRSPGPAARSPGWMSGRPPWR
jgi:hypothetical protein